MIAANQGDVSFNNIGQFPVTRGVVAAFALSDEVVGCSYPRLALVLAVRVSPGRIFADHLRHASTDLAVFRGILLYAFTFISTVFTYRLLELPNPHCRCDSRVRVSHQNTFTSVNDHLPFSF